MNEERDLLIAAGKRLRKARPGLLFAGLLILALCVAVVGRFHPAVNPGVDDTGLLWLWLDLAMLVIGGTGISMIASSLRFYRYKARTETWFLVVTAIPLVGGLILWMAKRRDAEVVNP